LDFVFMPKASFLQKSEVESLNTEFCLNLKLLAMNYRTAS